MSRGAKRNTVSGEGSVKNGSPPLGSVDKHSLVEVI